MAHLPMVTRVCRWRLLASTLALVAAYRAGEASAGAVVATDLVSVNADCDNRITPQPRGRGGDAADRVAPRHWPTGPGSCGVRAFSCETGMGREEGR